MVILGEVLSVLALATRQTEQGEFGKQSVACISPVADVAAGRFAKRLLGESDIEAVLQRLDRLTIDEARMTVGETLQIVHRLVNNMKLMDGTQALPD
jgi:hypothetical protein